MTASECLTIENEFEFRTTIYISNLELHIMGVRLRAVVSLCMLIMGVFQAVSGLLLFFAPRGRGSGNVLLFGLTKHTWSD